MGFRSLVALRLFLKIHVEKVKKKTLRDFKEFRCHVSQHFHIFLTSTVLMLKVIPSSCLNKLAVKGKKDIIGTLDIFFFLVVLKRKVIEYRDYRHGSMT